MCRLILIRLLSLLGWLLRTQLEYQQVSPLAQMEYLQVSPLTLLESRQESAPTQ